VSPNADDAPGDDEPDAARAAAAVLLEAKKQLGCSEGSASGDPNPIIGQIDEHSDMPLPLVEEYAAREKEVHLLILDVLDSGLATEILRTSSRISGAHCLCWARALAGEGGHDRDYLLEFGMKVAGKVANASADECRILAAANKNVPGNKFARRMMAKDGNELRRQLEWMASNASASLPAEHYPKGAPHLTAYCYLDNVALVVLQEKNRGSKPGAMSDGFYATAYGRERPLILTQKDLAGFLARRRPQDRIVVLRDLAGPRSVSAGASLMHFDAHLVSSVASAVADCD